MAKNIAVEKKNFKEMFEGYLADYHSGNQYKKQQAEEKIYLLFKTDIDRMVQAKYPSYCIYEKEDLLQTAYLALFEALPRFRIEMCANPMSYFFKYIVHSIQDYINQNHNHSTIHYETMYNKIRKAEDTIMAAGKAPTDILVSEVSKVPLGTVKKVRKLKYATSTLERDDGKDEYGEWLPEALVGNNQVLDPAEEVEAQELREAVAECMDTVLTDKEKRIIELAYGFEDGHPCTPKEIVDIMGITVNELRTVKLRAERKLSISKLRDFAPHISAPYWLRNPVRESETFWQNSTGVDNIEVA